MTAAIMEVESEKQFDRTTIIPDKPLPIESLGGGLKLTSKRTVELNHEFARWVLERPEYCADRPLRNSGVAYLLNAAKRGTFHPEWVMIITCTFDGKEYRMNGQHTCWMRLEMDEDWRCPIAHYRYHAETDDDMRRLYASIDRNNPRTNGNVSVSYLFDSEEYKGFSKRVCRAISEGIAYWLYPQDSARSSHDADDRCFLLKTSHLQLGRKVATFLETCNAESKHMLRRPVIASLFATFHKAQAAATDFWQPVRDGTGFKDTEDARLKLRNQLMSSSVAVGAGAAEEKRSVKTEEMYRWCLHAWNAYRMDRPIKQLKASTDGERPTVR